LVLVLSRAGLALAYRLRVACAEPTTIVGPSCIVGACGGPAESAGAAVGVDELPPGTFATAEPGIFGFTGPLRKVFPALWSRFDAIVAMMPLAKLVHLAGPLASDTRCGPTVVVVDDVGRFAVSVLDGRGTRADDLTHEVAAILGAVPVVTSSRGRLVPHDVGRR
jgi:cobalt-precorrin 5A hydrolase